MEEDAIPAVLLKLAVPCSPCEVWQRREVCDNQFVLAHAVAPAVLSRMSACTRVAGEYECVPAEMAVSEIATSPVVSPFCGRTGAAMLRASKESSISDVATLIPSVMATLLASGARARGRRERTTLSETHCVHSAAESPISTALELATRPSAAALMSTVACSDDAVLASSGKEVKVVTEKDASGRRRRW
jgi:hypothetical protein